LLRWLFEGFLAAAPSPFVADRPDDPERASRAGFLARVGFLKSRVYAKLVRHPILKRYQTFNGEPSKPVGEVYNIGSP
jgi:hypothetical protein